MDGWFWFSRMGKSNLIQLMSLEGLVHLRIVTNSSSAKAKICSAIFQRVIGAKSKRMPEQKLYDECRIRSFDLVGAANPTASTTQPTELKYLIPYSTRHPHLFGEKITRVSGLSATGFLNGTVSYSRVASLPPQ